MLIALVSVVSISAAVGIVEPDLIPGLSHRVGAQPSPTGIISLGGRIEIWDRALAAIEDFPFTGCGLGAFRKVVWRLYPLLKTSDTTDIAHAHNIFLQVALDTGIPGLIAYVALLCTAAMTALRTALTKPAHRHLALGLLGGLVALHTFGLTDALAPGSKPGLIFWTMLGLLTAADRLSRKDVTR